MEYKSLCCNKNYQKTFDENLKKIMEYKSLRCNRNYQITFDENLTKRFANTYKFVSLF